MSIAFLKALMFGAVLTDTGNPFQIGGTRFENVNFLRLVRLWLINSLFSEFLICVNSENVKNFNAFISSKFCKILYAWISHLLLFLFSITLIAVSVTPLYN